MKVVKIFVGKDGFAVNYKRNEYDRRSQAVL